MANAGQLGLALYGGYTGATSALGRVGLSTSISTGVNASIEAESTFSRVLEETGNEEEALAQANRTFRRNSIANSGTEALQMGLWFLPGGKALQTASPWIKALANSGRVVVAGGTEAVQERAEDSIQEQAPVEDFDFEALWDKVSYAGWTRQDMIAFTIGAIVQGGGNIISNRAFKEAADEQVKEVAARLPDDGQGGSAEAKVERAYENDPEVVAEAVSDLQEEVAEASEVVREQAKVARLTNLAQEALNQGYSRNEVALTLSSQLNPDQAQELVLALPEPKTITIPTAQDLLGQTPDNIQKSIREIDTNFQNETAELNNEIEALSKAVKEAPNNTQQKVKAKRELAEKRAELRKLSTENANKGNQTYQANKQAITEAVKATKAKQLSDSEAKVVAGKVIDQTLRPGLDVPVQAIVDNEVNRYKPSRTATREQVKEAVSRATENKKSQEALVDEVLNTLENKNFEPVLAELSLDEVVTEVQKSEGLFQEAKRVEKKQKIGKTDKKSLETAKQPSKEGLIAVHNISSDQLVNADKIGGLANPSMATFDPNTYTLSKFGEISLIGDSGLITSRRANTYSSDVFSPVFPSIRNDYDYTKSREFLKKNGIEEWDFDLEKFSRNAGYSRVLQELFLKGINKLPKDFDRKDYGDIEKMNAIIKKNHSEFNEFLSDIRSEIGIYKDNIFNGFTPTGKRRYIDVTAANVSKIMNEDANRAGEDFFYGLGSLRAIVTPSVSSVSRIKKEQHRLVSSEQFEKIRDEYEAELVSIAEKLDTYRTQYRYASGSVDQELADYYRGQKDAFSTEYSYEKEVPQSLIKEIDDFGEKLRNMPTEYFETKFRRVVDIGEFRAAVVPDDLPSNARAVLEKYRLDIFEYNKDEEGGEANLASAIQQVTDANESLLFQSTATSQLGYPTVTETMKKQLAGLPFMQSVPLYVVDRITTPEGFEAFGRFYRGAVDIVQNPDITTIPHEAFHVATELGLSPAERQAMFKEARDIYGSQLETDREIEERLAQDFAEWYVTEKYPMNFSDKLKGYFQKIKDFLLSLVGGDQGKQLRKIFNRMFDNEIAENVKVNGELQAQQFFEEAQQEFYQNPEGFTLKLFGHPILNKKDIGYQETLQAIKQMGLKKGEIMIHETVLERPQFKDQKKFDSEAYKSAVKGDLIQFKVVETESYADTGLENINKDGRYNPADATTYFLDTDFHHGKSGGHLGSEALGLHSWFRAVEDVNDKAFRVMEIQSDPFQHNRYLGITEESLRDERNSKLQEIIDSLENNFLMSTKEGIFLYSRKYLLNKIEELELGGFNLKEPKETIENSNDDFRNESGYAPKYGKQREIRIAALEKLNKQINEQKEAVINATPITQEDIDKGILDKENYELNRRINSEKSIITAALDRIDTTFDDLLTNTDRALIQKVNGITKSLRELGFNVENLAKDNEKLLTRNPNRNDVKINKATLRSEYLKFLNESNALLERQKNNVVSNAVTKETVDRINSLTTQFNSMRNTWFELTLRTAIRKASENNAKYLDFADTRTLANIESYTGGGRQITLYDGQSPEEVKIGDKVKYLENKAVVYGIDRDHNSFKIYYASDGADIIVDKVKNVEAEKEEDGIGDDVSVLEYVEDGNDGSAQVFNDDSGVEYVVWAPGGEYMNRSEASAISGEADTFSLQNLKEEYRTIAAKYGVNEIDGKKREGDYYKALKKLRPDLELFTDKNGFTWWRTKITKEDSLGVPLYQDINSKRDEELRPLHNLAEEAPADYKFFEDLYETVEQVTFEVETLLELSEAGYRLHLPGEVGGGNDNVVGVSSTFPDWVPEHLRSSDLFSKVLKQRRDGLKPNGSRQQELHDVIRDRILDQLPLEMLNQYLLDEYYSEQHKIADQLRQEALDVLLSYVAELDSNPSILAKKDVKKTVRLTTGQIRTETREFSKKMKERSRFFNRGYKTGYKQGARDKLAILLESKRTKKARTDKISKLKDIYRRVRRATRTGAYLPIPYQKRLTEFFDGLDMTTMTKKTQKKLQKMATYFEGQEGAIPKDVAEKLSRLSKTPIGKMPDEALEAIIMEASRIFEQGVLKKKLLDAKAKREFQDRVTKVAGSINNDRPRTNVMKKGVARGLSSPLRSGFRIATLDPARVADMVDNTHGTYSGDFYREVETVGKTEDIIELTEDVMIGEALQEIQEHGDLSADEINRLAYFSLVDQDRVDEAETYQEYYEKFTDLKKPRTEKEQAILGTWRSAFKDIRGGVAATYEAEYNKPFPDNPNYLPVIIDKTVENFDIREEDFFGDDSPTKTSQGFTKARQEGANRLVSNDFMRDMIKSLSKQIYYAKMQPVLTDFTRIVNAKGVQSRLTHEEQQYFKVYIHDIATRGYRSQAENAFVRGLNKTMGWTRKNINVAILGYKLSTILIQPMATFEGASLVNKRFGTSAAVRVATSPLKLTYNPGLIAETKARSLSIQNRAGGDIELKELREAQRNRFSITPYGKLYNTWQKYAMTGIRMTDVATAGANHNEIVKLFMEQGLTETQAVAEANQMVRLTHSSTNISHRPQFLNSESVRFFFRFQSFLTNAFNLMTYDLVETEIRQHGTAGVVKAANNLQWIFYAIASVAILRDLQDKLWGYDDEDETWTEKLWAETIGRLPLSSLFIDYDGSFKGKIDTESLPEIKAANRVLKLLGKAIDSEKEATTKDIYNAARGTLEIFGVGGTGQVSQIITAPDIMGLGSIGDQFGLVYHGDTNHERRVEVIKNFKGEITGNDLDTIAERIYRDKYTDGDAHYKANKRAELIKYVAFMEKYPDDEFVLTVLGKKNNNEVKAYVATNNLTRDEIHEYAKKVNKFGVDNDIIKSTLRSELIAISKTSQADKEKIAALGLAENDDERKEIIGSGSVSKSFAKLAWQKYGLISKELYEEI